MASANESVLWQAMDAIGECSACHQLIKGAASLPCMHSFCSSCLGNRSIDGAAVDGTAAGIRCSVCRRNYPTSGVWDNRFLQLLIDEFLSSRTTSSGTGTERSVCDFCTEDETEPEPDSKPETETHGGSALATVRCLDCRRNLCPDCCRGHRKHCRDHTIADLDDVVQRRRSLLRSVERCRQHPEDSLKLFCFDCSSVICTVCFAEAHRSHSCKDLGKVATDMQTQLRENQSRLDLAASGWFEALGSGEKQLQALEEDVRTGRSMIREMGERLKRMVDDHVTKLTEKLDLVSQAKRAEYEAAQKNLEGRIVCADYLKKYTLVLIENGSPCHVADSYHRLRTRTAELEKEITPTGAGTARQRIEVVFAEPDPVDLLAGETEMRFGRISVSEIPEKPREEAKGDDRETVTTSQRRVQHLLGTIETDGRGVTGVTVLNERIYIVCAWTNTIFVHLAQHPFSRQGVLTIKELRCPNDLAACHESSCLFVVDSDSGHVWRVTAGGHCDRWPIRAGQPWTISVNRGRIVLPCDGKSPQLNVYGLGGSLLHRIRLPAAIAPVQHAVELANGHFVVCQGRGSGQVNRICEVSKNGNMVRCFDGVGVAGSLSSPLGSLSSPMVRWPKHVAVDADDNLFVAECSNHYVLHLDNCLNLKAVLLSWDEDRIDAPSRLCCLSNSGHLVLGEAAAVKVFDLRERLMTKTSNGCNIKRSESSGSRKK